MNFSYHFPYFLSEWSHATCILLKFRNCAINSVNYSRSKSIRPIRSLIDGDFMILIYRVSSLMLHENRLNRLMRRATCEPPAAGHSNSRQRNRVSENRARRACHTEAKSFKWMNKCKKHFGLQTLHWSRKFFSDALPELNYMSTSVAYRYKNSISIYRVLSILFFATSPAYIEIYQKSFSNLARTLLLP